MPELYPNYRIVGLHKTARPPVIQHNLILSTSQMENWNFIQLSDPKSDFILLSGKSAVGQEQSFCYQGSLKQRSRLHCSVLALGIIDMK